MQERVCYPCFPVTGATLSGASGGSRVRLTYGLCAPRRLDLIRTKDGNYCSAYRPSFHPAWRRHATCLANLEVRRRFPNDWTVTPSAMLPMVSPLCS